MLYYNWFDMKTVDIFSQIHGNLKNIFSPFLSLSRSMCHPIRAFSKKQPEVPTDQWQLREQKNKEASRFFASHPTWWSTKNRVKLNTLVTVRLIYLFRIFLVNWVPKPQLHGYNYACASNVIVWSFENRPLDVLRKDFHDNSPFTK